MRRLILEVDEKASGAEIYEKGSPKLDALRASNIDKYTICQKIFTEADRILTERISYLRDPSKFSNKLRTQYTAILSAVKPEDMDEVPPRVAEMIKKSSAALNLLTSSVLDTLGDTAAGDLQSRLKVKCVFSTPDQWRLLNPTSPTALGFTIGTSVYIRLGPRELIVKSGKTILKNESDLMGTVFHEILHAENYVIADRLFEVLKASLSDEELQLGRMFTSPDFLALAILKNVYKPLTLTEYRSELARMPETKATLLSYFQVEPLERQVGLDPVALAYSYASTLMNNSTMLRGSLSPEQIRAAQLRLDTGRDTDDYLREMLKPEHVRIVLLGLQRYINSTAASRGADWREDVMKSNLFSGDEPWLALILPLIPGTKQSLDMLMQVAKAETGAESSALAERWMRLAGIV